MGGGDATTAAPQKGGASASTEAKADVWIESAELIQRASATPTQGGPTVCPPTKKMCEVCNARPGPRCRKCNLAICSECRSRGCECLCPYYDPIASTYDPGVPYEGSFCVQCQEGEWNEKPWRAERQCRNNCVMGKAFCRYCVVYFRHNCEKRPALKAETRGTTKENEEQRRRRFRSGSEHSNYSGWHINRRGRARQRYIGSFKTTLIEGFFEI